MKKIRIFAVVVLICLSALSIIACSGKKGWTRNDSATVGMGSEARSAVRLANDEAPSEKAPVTGAIFLIKTEISDEFIVSSIEFKLFGDSYVKNTVTGGLTIENGGGRSYSRSNLTANFSVYSNSATNQEQNYFTLRFSLTYEDEDGNIKSTYNFDQHEDTQIKVTLQEDLTFKFSYTGSDSATQQFEYTIAADSIKKA